MTLVVAGGLLLLVPLLAAAVLGRPRRDSWLEGAYLAVPLLFAAALVIIAWREVR